MSERTWSEAELAVENARLTAQVKAFSGTEHLYREVAPWLNASPEQRIAETWRLCALLPWLRSLWPEDVRQRADAVEPMPEDTVAILERLKRDGVGK